MRRNYQHDLLPPSPAAFQNVLYHVFKDGAGPPLQNPFSKVTMHTHSWGAIQKKHVYLWGDTRSSRHPHCGRRQQPQRKVRMDPIYIER